MNIRSRSCKKGYVKIKNEVILLGCIPKFPRSESSDGIVPRKSLSASNVSRDLRKL